MIMGVGYKHFQELIGYFDHAGSGKGYLTPDAFSGQTVLAPAVQILHLLHIRRQGKSTHSNFPSSRGW